MSYLTITIRRCSGLKNRRLQGLVSLLLALMLIAPSFNCAALSEAEEARKTLALNYLQAYVGLDFTKLSYFYSDSTIWRDISAAKKIKGTRNILRFLQESTVGIRAYRFIPDQIYIGSSSVSLIGSYEIETEGTLYGKPNKQLFLTIPGITVLTVSTKNQLITEHLDILDYTSLQEQLDAM